MAEARAEVGWARQVLKETDKELRKFQTLEISTVKNGLKMG